MLNFANFSNGNFCPQMHVLNISILEERKSTKSVILLVYAENLMPKFLHEGIIIPCRYVLITHTNINIWDMAIRRDLSIKTHTRSKFTDGNIHIGWHSYKPTSNFYHEFWSKKIKYFRHPHETCKTFCL